MSARAFLRSSVITRKAESHAANFRPPIGCKPTSPENASPTASVERDLFFVLTPRLEKDCSWIFTPLARYGAVTRLVSDFSYCHVAKLYLNVAKMNDPIIQDAGSVFSTSMHQSLPSPEHIR